ncbi:MAG: hypothetical protein CFE44_25870, partial [Burkholderiales bacterium PBB4]
FQVSRLFFIASLSQFFRSPTKTWHCALWVLSPQKEAVSIYSGSQKRLLDNNKESMNLRQLAVVTNVHHLSPQMGVRATKTQSFRKPRLSISLPSELYSEVEKIAKRDSRSMGWVIRKAVEAHVQSEQPLFYRTST